MSEPTDLLVPYLDPYDDPYTDDILISLLDDSNPNLADLDSVPHPNPHNGIANHIAQPNDSLNADHVMWDWDQTNIDTHSQTQQFQIHAQTSTNYDNVGQSQNTDYYCNNENAQPLSVWPVPPLPYSCSCCQILRDIIHTNGNHTMKLEIHGRLGMICHAVLVHQYFSFNETSSTLQPQMFDFCRKSIDDVKQFLREYCMDRALAGYRMLQDPLSIFYETLCVGMDWDLFNDDSFLPTSPTSSGEAYQMDQNGAPETQTTDRNVPKTSLSAQRERTGKLTLKDFVEYFHLPIEEAAKRLNLCPTVVKKICRRGGLNRWPHRKIKSIARQMSSLRENLDSYSPGERANAVAEIERLQQEMANICSRRPEMI